MIKLYALPVLLCGVLWMSRAYGKVSPRTCIDNFKKSWPANAQWTHKINFDVFDCTCIKKCGKGELRVVCTKHRDATRTCVDDFGGVRLLNRSWTLFKDGVVTKCACGTNSTTCNNDIDCVKYVCTDNGVERKKGERWTIPAGKKDCICVENPPGMGLTTNCTVGLGCMHTQQYRGVNEQWTYKDTNGLEHACKCKDKLPACKKNYCIDVNGNARALDTYWDEGTSTTNKRCGCNYGAITQIPVVWCVHRIDHCYDNSGMKKSKGDTWKEITSQGTEISCSCKENRFDHNAYKACPVN